MFHDALSKIDNDQQPHAEAGEEPVEHDAIESKAVEQPESKVDLSTTDTAIEQKHEGAETNITDNNNVQADDKPKSQDSQGSQEPEDSKSDQLEHHPGGGGDNVADRKTDDLEVKDQVEIVESSKETEQKVDAVDSAPAIDVSDNTEEVAKSEKEGVEKENSVKNEVPAEDTHETADEVKITSEEQKSIQNSESKNDASGGKNEKDECVDKVDAFETAKESKDETQEKALASEEQEQQQQQTDQQVVKPTAEPPVAVLVEICDDSKSDKVLNPKLHSDLKCKPNQHVDESLQHSCDCPFSCFSVKYICVRHFKTSMHNLKTAHFHDFFSISLQDQSNGEGMGGAATKEEVRPPVTKTKSPPFQRKQQQQSGGAASRTTSPSSTSRNQQPQEAGKSRKGDIFKDINNEITQIQKSKSRSDIFVHNELSKSASRSRFLEQVKQKKEEEVRKVEDARREREESQAITDAEAAEKKRKEHEREIDRKNSIANRKINQFDDMPKKLDEVFGPVREAPATIVSAGVYVDPDFDPGQKEISGISETVKLKKSERKPVKQEVKKDKPKFELPAKPAKFPKANKPKPAKEPTPPPKEPTPPPPPRSPSPPPLKEATPPPPPPKDPTPIPPPVEEEEQVAEVRGSPTKILAPRVGINGFNGVGRLVLRAAIESGIDVKAVNDPFVPLHYMVYMLKFDIAHASTNYHEKEMNVRESPTGALVINGKVVHVYAGEIHVSIIYGWDVSITQIISLEHDVTKIPWELSGVNYVVEATEVLNTKADAKLHFKDVKKGVRMKHLLEMEAEAEAPASLTNGDEHGDPLSPLSGGVKRVLIAGPSPDAPLAVTGVNDDKINPATTEIISHASAAASALAPVLTVIHKKFGLKACSYTLLKSIRGHSKDSMKCANVGPSSHTRSVKWDFTENLVPTVMSSLNEEALRLMPFLHKKFNGSVVYVPTPEVSMFDLTLTLEKNVGDTLYRDVCLALKEAASVPPLKTVLRYCMKMSDENSASSLFASETHSSIVDAKSGMQITSDTVKLVIWFDNESGHAYRIVDLIANCHEACYPPSSEEQESQHQS